MHPIHFINDPHLAWVHGPMGPWPQLYNKFTIVITWIVYWIICCIVYSYIAYYCTVDLMFYSILTCTLQNLCYSAVMILCRGSHQSRWEISAYPSLTDTFGLTARHEIHGDTLHVLGTWIACSTIINSMNSYRPQHMQKKWPAYPLHDIATGYTK